MLEYQNIKILLQKAVPNWCKEGFVFKRLKIPRQGHMLLVI